MSSDDQPGESSMEFWRTKCLNLEKVVKTLSNHCVRVVEKHEDLLIDFKKNQEQHKKLKTKFQEKGEQIKKAREVLIPVSNELKALREKYEIAVRCQMEAETFAVKTTHKNKELKRQSQMLIQNLGSVNVVDINIDALESTEDDVEEKEYMQKMSQQIDDLEQEKSDLSAQVAELAENFQDEKEVKEQLKAKNDHLRDELRKAKLALKDQENLSQQVVATSEKAYKEYQDMEQTYKKELVVRNEAERVASRLFTEREQARRESAMALSKVADNKKLMDAMLEIQDVNAKSAQMKEDFERKIAELEDQLNAAKVAYDTEGVESETEELAEERNSLKEQLEKSEAAMTELRKQYTDLMEKYNALETKHEESLRPPPPPPPPGPPPPLSKAGGFLSRIVGRKEQRERAKEHLKKGGVALNDHHTQAVEEMMKRIKSGNIGLRPVLTKQSKSLPEKDEPSAMNELQGLLSKMKKSKSEDDLSVFGDSTADEDSELAKILKKRQQAIQEPEPQGARAISNFRPKPMPRKLSTIADEEDEPE